LALKFNGEIVNADSRQVYHWMDIGTAKPDREDFNLVPHHLFDIIDPDQEFSLAQYQELASQSIQNIHRREKLPFLVGGSGQYVWAVMEGWIIPRVPPDLELRRSLEKKALDQGADVLYAQLSEIDPVAASKIDKRNLRRVIRALEVSLQTQAPFSTLKNKNAPDYQTLIIGLTADRDELYRRTDLRVEEMIRQGLIQETKNLVQKGYSTDLPALSSIGYQQIARMLKGEITQEEAVRQIKVGNHRFIRHQYAWFRLKDQRIHWFDIRNDILPEVMSLIANHISEDS